jgi:polysaccharide chain length determinant protein (PEP-CTERM system associated)
VLVLGVAVTLLLPPKYRSAGTILIESQQIPTDLVQATVTSYADERIEVIKQRVMTRENLLRIIRKYGLFADAGPTFTPSDQIDEMRETISVDLINATVRSERGRPTTIAFSVGFEHKRPEVAQAVANDLVTLFLDENVKVRTQRATQTTEFLSEEADKLKKELDGFEARIAQYKERNGNALADNTALAMAALQRTESDLRSVERDYASAEDALRTADYVTTGDAAGRAELDKARAEVAELSAKYTPQHPDLKAAQRRLEALESESAKPAAGVRRVSTRSDAREEGLRQRMKMLAAERANLRARLGRMEAALARSPAVEQGLAAMTRDYQMAQKKYEEIVAKKMTAQMAENLEDDQKAERFSVIEPPTLADKPAKPDRKKLLALSLVMAMGAPFGAVSLMESLRGVVRGVGSIAALVGQQPLVTIPFIPVAAELERRRRIAFTAAGIALALIVAVLLLVHFFVLPLDVLVMKALIRLG